MKLVDQITKSVSGISTMGGRKLEEPDTAITIGGRCEGPATTEPDRPTSVGTVAAFCIAPADHEPRPASWADLPATFVKDGLFGERRKD